MFNTFFLSFAFINTVACPGQGWHPLGWHKELAFPLCFESSGENHKLQMLQPSKAGIKDIFFYLSKKYFCLSTERFCILFDFVSLSADVLVSELEKKYYNYKFVNESLL